MDKRKGLCETIQEWHDNIPDTNIIVEVNNNAKKYFYC